MNGAFGFGEMRSLFAENEAVLHQAQTMAFTTLAFCELFHMAGMSNLKRSVFHVFKNRNKMMALAFVLGILLQIFVVETPVVQDVFSTFNLSGKEWLITALLSLVPLVFHEIMVLVHRIRGEK